MAGKERVCIGCAAGFWGDTETAAAQLLATERLDYLVFDYLAEITMSIMAGARMRRPDGGHAHDFVTRVMKANLATVMAQGVKVVTNAGGVNPQAAREALQALAAETGHTPKIAIVLGDDLMDRKDQFAGQVKEMFTGAPLPDSVVSMNAYLGAAPIVEALAQGADIVITGRVVDSALVLAPLMHEFGWKADDHDLLAAGSLAGHIVECGAQATGGIFTDWEPIAYDNVGFPIIDCEPDGSFELSKPEGTDGLVSPAVVYEQLVYEIGDPRAYMLPDVVCDFTQVRARQVGEGRVRVQGATGKPPPAHYKVSATYMDGFKTSTGFLVLGQDAARKAQRVAEALLKKTSKLLRERGFADFKESRIDIIGAEATYGPQGRAQAAREVVMRLAVSHESGDALKLMLRELPQAGTGMAPGLANSVGGRPGSMPVIRLFSFLVDPTSLNVCADIDGKQLPVAVGGGPLHFDAGALQSSPDEYPPIETDRTVPLIELAHGRSGDKGDHCNIGILARDPAYVSLIGAALTEAAVAKHMAHLLDPARGKVHRWAMPGCHGWNFLLEHSLGGGGIASLRPDPQGKGFAQQLLAFEVPVPDDLYAALQGTES